MKLRLLSFVFVLFLSPFAFSATWYVDDNSNTNDIYTSTSASGADGAGVAGSTAAPFATLSYAITRASNGDVIYVDAGTWGRTGTYLGIDNAINKQLTIIGAGSGLTLYDASNGANYFANITASNVTIKNMTLTRYFYDNSSSGQVFNIVGAYTGIVLDGIVITKCLGGSSTLANINIGSTAGVTIKNSFLKCSGYNGSRGGGVSISGTPTVTIDNVLFKQNENHFGDGGAIQIAGTPTVSVINSTFSQCYSNSGGAISQSGGALTVSGSCFNENWTLFDSSSDGGGAYYATGGTSSFTNCTFTSNQTTNNYLINNGSSKGGALYIAGVTSTLSICSFTTNNSSSTGEDIYVNSGTINVNNTRFESIYTGSQANVVQAGGTVNFYKSGIPTASPSGIAITNPETSGTITTFSTIGTPRTDVAGFGTWTDVLVTNTTQMDLKSATSSMTSPSYSIVEPTANLIFDIKRVGTASAPKNVVTVEYSTNGGGAWTTLGTYTNTTTSWTTQTVSINFLSGLSPIFRFSSLTADGTIGIALDNISVKQSNTDAPLLTASTECVDASVIVSCAVASITCATEVNPPVIFTCVPDKTIAGTCSTTMPDYRPEVVAYDDCLFTIAQSPAPGTPLSPGSSYTVTMTVSDLSPNSPDATCTFTVTVTGSGISAPVVGTITQPTCSVATGSVDLSGLPSSGTWTLTATPGALTMTGTGTTATFVGLSANTNYTFTVTDGVSGCVSPASSIAAIAAQPSTPTPTGNATQTFCINQNATVNDLVATGTAIQWYLNPTGGTALSTSTALINNTHYYASQTVTGCESAVRLDVLVTITALPVAGTLTADDATLCTSTSTTVSSSVSGGSWSSSNNAIATVNATTGLVNAIASGTAIMTYTVSGTGACSATSATATINIDVTQAPDAGTLSADDATLCSGTSTTVSSTVSGGSWSSSNNAFATVNASSGLVNAIAAGTAVMTYTVSGTAGCSGTNSTATINIDVTQAPDAGTLSADDATLCSGTSTTVSSSVSGGSWSSSNNAFATVNASSGLVNAIAAGTAVMTYTVSGTAGCSGTNSTATINIDVTQAPDAGTLSADDATLCSGTSTTVSSTVSGGSWSSSNNAFATVNASSGLVNAIAAGTAVMTYTVSGTAGCSGTNSTATINIDVTQAPDAGTLSADDATLCSGTSTTVSSTVSGGAWSSSNNAFATVNASSGLVNAIAAGTAVMTYTVSGTAGCSGTNSTATINIDVTQAPDAGTLSADDATLCSGTSTTVSSTVSGGSWSSSNNAFATVNASTGLVNAIAAGTAVMTYTVSGAAGCTGINATNTVNIDVTQTPTTGTITPIGASLCLGGTTTMSSNVSGGTWVSDNPSIATIDLNSGLITAIAVGIANMTYTVNGVAACLGTNVSASQSITIISTPTAGTLSALDSTLCQGSTTTASSTSLGGTWVSSNPSVATVDLNSGLVTAISTGTTILTYTVYGTGSCVGSNASATLDISVSLAPIAGALSAVNPNLCAGSTTTVSSSVSGGTWTSSNTAFATVNPTTGLVTAISAGTAVMTYTVAGTSYCLGTNATATININVTNAPTAGTLTALDSSLCSGTTTTVSSTISGGSWLSSNSSVATVDSNTGLVTAISAGSAIMTYTVNGTGVCAGVNDSETITIDVTQAPVAGTISALDSTLCSGTTTIISSTVLGGTWTSSNTSVATVDLNTGLITAVSGGSSLITYTVNGSGACLGTNSTGTLTINVTSAPDAGTLSAINATLCSGSTTTVSSTIIGGTWSSADNTIATVDANTGLVTAVSVGNVFMTYTVNGSGACIGTNATDSTNITVTNTPTAGILTALDSSLCEGSTTIVSSTITGGSWLSLNPSVATVDGNTGLVTAISSGTATMTYTVIGSGACSGVTETETLDIDVTAAPISGILSSLDSTLCSGTTTIISSSVIGGVWTSSNPTIATVNSSTGLISAISAGTVDMIYTVNGTGACLGNDAVDSLVINVTNAPNSGVLTLNDTTLCSGSTTIANSSITGGTWTSSNSSIATVNPNTGLVTAISNGTAILTYTVSGVGACLGTDATATISVIVNLTPTAPTGSQDQYLCNSDDPTLDNLVTVPTVGITWYDASISGNVLLPSTSLTDGGIYYASQSINGCESTSRLQITVHLSYVSMVLVSQTTPKCHKNNGSIEVVGLNGIGSYSYLWSNGITSALNSNIGSGTYSVSVTDSIGCEVSQSFDLGCTISEIPQIISPNENGKNENWILNLEPTAKVEIYNRWGNLVYSAIPYNDDWNGKPNVGDATGKDFLPSGTYFYIINMNNGEKPLSGYIELVR